MSNSNQYTIKDIKAIAESENSLHPSAELSDYYKLFFQAYFGQGHFISNKEQSENWLADELAAMKHEYLPYIQDISNKKGIYRVSLSVVADGLLPFDKYFKLFISGNNSYAASQKWSDAWSGISDKLLQWYPFLVNSDLIIKCRSLSLANSLPSHSETFRLTYAPHYRVMQLTETEIRLFNYVPK